MQVKEQLKNWIAKSVFNLSPNLFIGMSMVNDRVFTWGSSGQTAYNNKIFYTATNILVGKLIEAPITFNKKKPQPKGKLSKFYSKSVSNEERAYIKTQNLIELEDHPLNLLFDNPNDYQSGIELMEDFWHNYTFGDGLLYFEGLGELSRDKKPKAIHSLSCQRLTAYKSNDKFNSIAYYTYTCNNGEVLTLQPNQVLHLKHWNPNLDYLKGMGINEIAGIDIALNTEGNKTEGAAFVNGGRGTLFSGESEVTQDGTVVNKLSVQQISALKDTVMQDMVGSHNNRKLKFTNGKVIVTPYGDTLAEMEVTKSEETRWRNIFAICGVPWALSPVGSQSSENSVIQGFKSLVTNTVISELRKFDQKLNGIIKQWYPEIICIHDLTEFTELAPDLKLMMEVYGKPTLSEDERRSVFGYEEMPDGLGKNYLVASGLMKIQDVVSDAFANMPPTPTGL